MESEGGVNSFQNPFIGWWLHQGTWEDVRIRDLFALQKLPINNTTEALISEKR